MSDTIYGVLAANTVHRVEFEGHGERNVEVLVRVEANGDDESPIYFKVGDDANEPSDSDIAIEGAGMEYACPATGVRVPAPRNANKIIIKMKSAGTPKYAIRVW